jgi:hypothetical protein
MVFFFTAACRRQVSCTVHVSQSNSFVAATSLGAGTHLPRLRARRGSMDTTLTAGAFKARLGVPVTYRNSDPGK